MLALRLTQGARPAVQLRRLLVAAASAGTGFLLLCALGHALGHPGTPSASLLRLAWCAAPLAATVYFAVAVARTDPGTRPRPGLSAVGLGPVRLMAVSATTTALACTLGSVVALLVFLHLRGDLTGMPVDGAATEFLATGRPLPLPAALMLLALPPVNASAAVAVALRPHERATGASRAEQATSASPAEQATSASPAGRRYGRFGAYRSTAERETFGAYGRFGRHLAAAPHGRRPTAAQRQQEPEAVPEETRVRSPGPDGASDGPAPAAGEPVAGEPVAGELLAREPAGVPAVGKSAAVPAGARSAPSGLPWGIAALAAGLAVETYASRGGAAASPGDRPGALAGLALTVVGLTLVGPGLTHLCGRLLQSVRPGALRLLAGRLLMTEATRIGRPLGVVCAVLSAAYAMSRHYYADDLSAGPLTLLGVLVVTGCTVATLLTAAVEAKHAHAGTTAALLRLGAPASTPRRAAALRAGALLALFGPLTVAVAGLSALPLSL
ncbi:hypothetical protein DIZ27_06995 [Streptomyces sp. NWU339]|uniref:hypothetical protein n=1 Tax=Streptomyces sp. NWU339 TaxID=2185284 RepID=UPI000D678E1B|nr:hypothetical protein [Streptomyces sp. NWU339]PWI11147.1 hypothetical protein DIZ27_06995 [Streptomyces sp. NWU339]